MHDCIMLNTIVQVHLSTPATALDITTFHTSHAFLTIEGPKKWIFNRRFARGWVEMRFEIRFASWNKTLLLCWHSTEVVGRMSSSERQCGCISSLARFSPCLMCLFMQRVTCAWKVWSLCLLNNWKTGRTHKCSALQKCISSTAGPPLGMQYQLFHNNKETTQTGIKIKHGWNLLVMR